MNAARRFAAIAAVILLSVLPVRAEERTILRLYTWIDYFDSEVLAAFEERFNCVVAIDTFDSNESMLETLADRDEDDHDYDLITPSAYMAARMHRQGLLQPIDHAALPNLAKVDAGFAGMTEDPDSVYSVPYTRTVTGIGYNHGEMPEPFDYSWSLFGRSDLAGRMTMLDDTRETLGAALKHLGYSLNTTDDRELAEAVALLHLWRGNLDKFEVDEGNIGLGTGQYAVVHCYNGDVALVMEENERIGFFVPKEGSAITADVFVIPASAKNAALAHSFINHFLEPGNAAANMASVLYYMPIPEALAKLDPVIRENETFAVPDDILAKCEVIRYLGPDLHKYESAWRQVVGE